MKRGIKIGLAVAMVASILGLGLIGCAKPAPAPAPAPTPTPAPAKVWKIKFATFHSTAHSHWEPVIAPFFEALEKNSGGRIVIDVYPAQSLVKLTAMPDALRTGIADMGFFVPTYHPSLFPLQEVWALPYPWSPARPTLSTYASTLDYFELHDKFLKEFEDKLNLHELAGMSFPGYDLYTISRPVYKMEDLKGLSLRAPTETAQKLLEKLGALPIMMSVADVYDSLKKGMLDGTLAPPYPVYGTKWYEPGKPGYFSTIGVFPGNIMNIMMSKPLYDSMPADLQKVINDAGRELSINWAKFSDELDVKAVEFLRGQGGGVIDWTEAEKQRLVTLSTPLWDEWGKAMDAKGLRGSEVVAAVKATAAKKR